MGKIAMDSTKKLPTWGSWGVKNPEKLSTSFMDGPLLVKSICMRKIFKI